MIPRLFAVTGNPVVHSKSPELWRTAFTYAKTGDCYFRLAADSAEEALKSTVMLGLSGINVTAPFKEEIAPLLAHLDDPARMIGAVNTISITASGHVGYNTDCDGVADSFVLHGTDPYEKNAVVVGAGGAAQAAVYGLMRAGAAVTIVNRTFEKARRIAVRFGALARPWEDLGDALAEAELLVNAANAPERVINPYFLHERLVVLDADYKRNIVAHDAAACGAQVIDGLNWLINQAVPAIQILAGITISPEIIRQGLSKPVKTAQHIALIGFMGSGKSTVGRLLDALTGMRFVDIDEEIETELGMTISQVFAEYGEPYFREIEHKILEKALVSIDPCVISCGGGVVLQQKNCALLTEKSRVVWLFTSIDTMLDRLKNEPGQRPLLNLPDPRHRAEELFDARKPLYAACSDIAVCAEGDPEAIALKIIRELGILQ